MKATLHSAIQFFVFDQRRSSMKTSLTLAIFKLFLSVFLFSIISLPAYSQIRSAITKPVALKMPLVNNYGGMSNEQTKILAKLVVNEIEQYPQKNIAFITTEQIKAIVGEIKFQQYERLTNPKQIAEFGSMVGAKYICEPIITTTSPHSFTLKYNLINLDGTIERSVSGTINSIREVTVRLESQKLIAKLFYKSLNFGLYLSAVAPTGDFANLGQNGYGASVFLEKTWPNGFGFRIRGEYVTFGQKEGADQFDAYSGYLPMRFTAKLTHIGAAIDGVYNAKSGFYAFAGLGVFSRSNSGVIEYQDPYNDDWILVQSHWEDYYGGIGQERSSGSFTAGIGYYFTDNIGFEIRSTYSGASWIQGGLTVRF